MKRTIQSVLSLCAPVLMFVTAVWLWRRRKTNTNRIDEEEVSSNHLDNLCHISENEQKDSLIISDSNNLSKDVTIPEEPQSLHNIYSANDRSDNNRPNSLHEVTLSEVSCLRRDELSYNYTMQGALPSQSKGPNVTDDCYCDDSSHSEEIKQTHSLYTSEHSNSIQDITSDDSLTGEIEDIDCSHDRVTKVVHESLGNESTFCLDEVSKASSDVRISINDIHSLIDGEIDELSDSISNNSEVNLFPISSTDYCGTASCVLNNEDTDVNKQIDIEQLHNTEDIVGPHDIEGSPHSFLRNIHDVDSKEYHCNTSEIPYVPGTAQSHDEWFGDTRDVGPLLYADDMCEEMNALNMVSSPPLSWSTADNASEGSGDSGRGTSIFNNGTEFLSKDDHSMYQFDIPSTLCGQLIGKRGAHIKYLKEVSGCQISIKDHPFTSQSQVCVIEGNQSEIQTAMTMIREKFPLSKHPNFDMSLSLTLQPSLPTNISPMFLKIDLPLNVNFPVVVSSIVNAGHVFVQHISHPSYLFLENLVNCMAVCYGSGNSVPQLPHPVAAGVICAMPIMNMWYRAEIVAVDEETDECDIRLLDYGGYTRMGCEFLRQIRADFMNLPFQATECILANVAPLPGENGFSAQATQYLERLSQGLCIRAQVVGAAPSGTTLINLYYVENDHMMFINEILIKKGLVSWVENV